MAWAQVRRPAPDIPVMMTVRGAFGRVRTGAGRSLTTPIIGHPGRRTPAFDAPDEGTDPGRTHRRISPVVVLTAGAASSAARAATIASAVARPMPGSPASSATPAPRSRLSEP